MISYLKALIAYHVIQLRHSFCAKHWFMVCSFCASDSESGSPLGGGSDSIVAKTVIRELRKASDDKKIKAIVLRIDSPGGMKLHFILLVIQTHHIYLKL